MKELVGAVMSQTISEHHKLMVVCNMTICNLQCYQIAGIASRISAETQSRRRRVAESVTRATAAALGVVGVTSASGAGHSRSFSVAAVRVFAFKNKTESGQIKRWASGSFWAYGLLQNYMVSY
ncbi:hypothetical protein E2542_SST15927 [Spatholobus suberectus]|nr:hypothetical protein E2542_SST15927 [Spatholobus suberectus]